MREDKDSRLLKMLRKPEISMRIKIWEGLLKYFP